jgi:HK97 family phage prohead protease
MTNSKFIRGYAAVYGAIGIGDGSFEKVARGAFDGLLAAKKPISLRWMDHSPAAVRLSNTSWGSLSLFSDDHGLAFEGELNMRDVQNWRRLREITAARDPIAFCSIGGLLIKAHRWEEYGASRCRVITEAAIDHIAICDRRASYQATAAWPSGPLDAASWKIRELADRWNEGRAQWRERERERERRSAAVAARCSSPPRQSRAIGRTVTGDFVMMCTTTGRLSLLSSAGAKSEKRR